MAFKSEGFSGILRPYYLEPVNIDKPEEPEEEVLDTDEVEDATEEEETNLFERTEEDNDPPSTTVSTRLFTGSDTLEDFDFANSDDLSILLDTQVQHESNYDPSAYNPGHGELGLTQFQPKIWNWAKEQGWIGQDEVRDNPASALKAQKAFMNYLYNKPFVSTAGSNTERWTRTLGSYVWGENNVRKAIIRATKETGDPNNWIEYATYTAVTYIKGIMRTASERKRTGFKSRYQWKKWGGLLYY